MGTNYYRIPSVNEMTERKSKFYASVAEMSMDPTSIYLGFKTPVNDDSYDYESPWEKFTNNTSVHLGKRSSGWKFCWNFHDNKHYSNKEELLEFIRGGRVVDEYGEEWNVDEFIEMALNWDGIIADEEYFRSNEKMSWFDWTKHVDKIVDGLRVSSATDFC